MPEMIRPTRSAFENQLTKIMFCGEMLQSLFEPHQACAGNVTDHRAGLGGNQPAY
jgi:hypothetical protein